MSQKEKKKLVSIKTDDTLMETALHGTHLFPYKLYDDNITDYDFNCIDWHWHTEFEFVYIESGIVHFNVGEDNFDMSEGQGIFINSKVVHKMHSENDAVIPNFLFLPSLIAPKESLIYQKFVLPFLNSSLGYYIFSSSQEWQKEKKKLVSIKTDDTLMETALHGTHLFPYKLYDDNITDYDFNCIDWHWHTEFEFVYIESGIVHFNVGEDNFDMSEGQGIFINSKVVHKMHSENDAVIPNFLFLPSLIAPKESLIYQKFVLPFLNSSLGYYIFSSSQEWQKEILSEMQKLIQFSRGEINELQISVQLQKIWALITSNVICYPETQNVNSSSLARLQMMMQFIHSNYPESISLLDIAKVGEVSISTALNLFRNVLNTSPVNYLICYRLRKAALLLTNTEKKVSAISIETGFSNTDYFCKTFKRMYSLTPTEYRNVKK